MIPPFVIFLREGIEASMIVAILLAYLDKIGQRRPFPRRVRRRRGRPPSSVIGGGIAAYTRDPPVPAASTAQTIFETAHLSAGRLRPHLHDVLDAVATAGRSPPSSSGRSADATGVARPVSGSGSLSFQAVGREASRRDGLHAWPSCSRRPKPGPHRHARARVLLPVPCARLLPPAPSPLAFVIFKLGRRLNLGSSSVSLGIVLMVFAAGLLADAVENMQQLGWFPSLGHTHVEHVGDPERGAARSATSSTVWWAMQSSPPHSSGPRVGRLRRHLPSRFSVRMGRRRAKPALSK